MVAWTPPTASKYERWVPVVKLGELDADRARKMRAAILSNGKFHVEVVADPIPEPRTLPILTACLIGLLAIARWKRV